VVKTLSKGLLAGFAGRDGEFHHLKNFNLPGSSHIYRNTYGKKVAGGAAQWLGKHPWSSLL